MPEEGTEGTELQAIVSHRVGAGDQSWALWKSSQPLARVFFSSLNSFTSGSRVSAGATGMYNS